MSRDLKKLTRELRAERCPEAVLDRVQAQVAQERRGRLVYYVGWAATAVFVIGILTVPLVRWSNQQPVVQPIMPGSIEERREVRKQAHLALAVFGQTLKRAGDHSRDTILEVSLPRLRQGLRTAREAISIPNKPNETNEKTSL